MDSNQVESKVVSTLDMEGDDIIVTFKIPSDILPQFMHWLCNRESERYLQLKFLSAAIGGLFSTLGAQ